MTLPPVSSVAPAHVELMLVYFSWTSSSHFSGEYILHQLKSWFPQEMEIKGLRFSHTECLFNPPPPSGPQWGYSNLVYNIKHHTNYTKTQGNVGNSPTSNELLLLNS